MLKVMRDSFQRLKWILVFVVFVFVLSVFVDWGAGGMAGSTVDSNAIAAQVNGHTVTIPEYRRALYFTEQRYREAYGQNLSPEMIEALGLQRQVLDSLVDQEILLSEARRMNLEATPEEIRKKILEIPTLNPDGKFVGATNYERYVKMIGYASAADFERDLANELTIAKLQNALQQTIAIPEKLVEAEYRRREENARIRYVLHAADRLAPNVTVAQAEVEQFYKANASRYSHPEQRRITYLFADSAKIASQITPTEQELRAQYERNKETYKSGDQVRAQHILIRTEEGASPDAVAAAEAKARGLVARLKAGADFGTVAKENSDDPGSAVNGGDLGFFGRGQMVPEFENAAFTQPVGEVGEPVKSQFGFHIVKVNEKRAGGYRSFDEVRGELQNAMVQERAKTQARDRIAQTRARLEQVKPLTEQALRNASDATVSYNAAPFFGKTDSIEGLGRVPAVNDWAFSAEAGTLGPVVDTPRGPVVPYLQQTRPAGIAPLAEIRPRVEADAKLMKARQQAAAAVRAAMRPGISLDALAAQLGTTAAEADVTREGYIQGLPGDISAVTTAALSGRQGEVKGPLVVDAGAVVLEIVKQKTFDRAAYEKAREGLARSLRENEALKLRASLLDKLKKKAEIEINEALVKPQNNAAAPVS